MSESRVIPVQSDQWLELRHPLGGTLWFWQSSGRVIPVVVGAGGTVEWVEFHESQRVTNRRPVP